MTARNYPESSASIQHVGDMSIHMNSLGHRPERSILEEVKDFKINDNKRMLIFLGAILGSFVNSMTYILSITGQEIKSFGLTQSEMTTISTIGKGIAFGCFFFGWTFDYFGPRVLMIAGMVLMLSGCLGFGLTFGGHLPGRTLFFALYYTMIAVSAAAVDVACILAANLTLPLNRGDVICCAKIIAALGSSFMSLYYASLFQGDYAAFMYFTAALCFLFSVFTTLNISVPPYIISGFYKRRMPEEEIRKRRETQVVYEMTPAPTGNIIVPHVVVIFSMIYLTITSLLISLMDLSRTTKIVFAVIATIALASYFLMLLPPRFFAAIGSSLPKIHSNKEAVFDTPGSIIVVNGVKQRVPLVSICYEKTFWQDLKTLRLWAMFWYSFSNLGVGFIVAFNSPQLFQALAEFSDVANARNAALIGVGSGLGRYFIGMMEKWFMSRRGYRKYYIVTFLPISPAITLLGFIFFLTLRGNALTIAWITYAFGNGMGWGIAPITSSLLYTQYSGKVYFFMFVAVTAALVVINTGVFGPLYDKGMEGKEPNSQCFECVRDTLILCMCLSVTSIIAALYVVMHYRRYILDRVLLSDEEYEQLIACSDSEAKRSSPSSNDDEDNSPNYNYAENNSNDNRLR